MRMRAAHLYENLVLSRAVSGWTGCISGEEILGTGPLSFTFLALLPPLFASKFLKDYTDCPKPSHFPSQTDRCIRSHSDNGSSKGVEHKEDVWLSGQEEYSPHNRELWNIFYNYLLHIKHVYKLLKIL